jgi:hypothetical protein
MTQQAMFTLHLIEDSDGQVRVVSDWSGEGQRCLALGIEIMQSLRDIQPYTNGELSFVLPTRTDIEH